MTSRFPESEWSVSSPGDVGVDESTLTAARSELSQVDASRDPRPTDLKRSDSYRVVVVYDGHILVEWNSGIQANARCKIASASKSVFSSILGIAIEEGVITSADARLAEYFPEALEVLPGEGPKDGRHARGKDREITLRQLLANTSGYLKPNEPPGVVKHYQTYGMNVLTHAIASAYGLYDAEAPEESPGFSLLVDTRLRIPLRASWEYYSGNFEYPEGARVGRFGNFPGIVATPRDMARLGWLWCQSGRWAGQQIIPEAWLREAVKPVPAEREDDPSRNMIGGYGLGFWTNATGGLWPSLPRDSFAALGAGGHVIWVCPSRDLVIVEGPGPVYGDAIDTHLFSTIVAAIDGN